MNLMLIATVLVFLGVLLIFAARSEFHKTDYASCGVTIPTVIGVGLVMLGLLIEAGRWLFSLWFRSVGF